jgi:hypothetical protein
MSPIDRAALAFVKHGVDFAAALERNYQGGFVFSTPDFFIMGREVDGGWFIEAMAGDMDKAWSILPYELSRIGFERFDNNLRWHPIETLRRLTLQGHEICY